MGKDFGSGTQASHEEEVGIQHGGIYGCQTLGAEWEVFQSKPRGWDRNPNGLEAEANRYSGFFQGPFQEGSCWRFSWIQGFTHRIQWEPVYLPTWMAKKLMGFHVRKTYQITDPMGKEIKHTPPTS